MAIRRKPPSPLPWVAREQGEADEYALLTADRTRWVAVFRLNGEQGLEWQRQNVDYLIHAAHRYPDLVGIIQELLPYARIGFQETGESERGLDGRARKLLNDCGEEVA